MRATSKRARRGGEGGQQVFCARFFFLHTARRGTSWRYKGCARIASAVFVRHN